LKVTIAATLQVPAGQGYEQQYYATQPQTYGQTYSSAYPMMTPDQIASYAHLTPEHVLALHRQQRQQEMHHTYVRH
jgi:hypothetical protein